MFIDVLSLSRGMNYWEIQKPCTHTGEHHTVSDILPIMTLQNSCHYSKSHGSAFGTPGSTASVRNIYIYIFWRV